MQHFFGNIQGWFSFRELYAEMVKSAPKDKPSIFIEIGAWKGKSTAFMGVEILNSHKPIKFYAVDTWLGSDEEAHRKDPDIMAGTLYKTFCRNLQPLIGANAVVNPMRMTSVQASKYFADESVDFLLLDGGHDYESVRDDLEAWLPKMKSDAVVAGDDYNWSGVKQAIFERFGEDAIEVLGENKGRHWRVKKFASSGAAGACWGDLPRVP